MLVIGFTVTGFLLGGAGVAAASALLAPAAAGVAWFVRTPPARQ